MYRSPLQLSVAEARDTEGEQEFSPTVLLSMSAELELSPVLTVHGQLEINHLGTLSFEPALDARLLGLSARVLPLFCVQGIQRVSGGRRVVIEAEQPMILRGAAAYQSWLILMALMDTRSMETGTEPVFMPATLKNLWGQLEGNIAVGRSAFGFATGENSLIFGPLSNHWEDLDGLERLDYRLGELQIHRNGQQRRLSLAQPLQLRDLLVQRWLNLDISRRSANSRPAVWRRGGSSIFGWLELHHAGLVFMPQSGPITVVVPRGTVGIVEASFRAEDEQPVPVLMVGTDESSLLEFQVRTTDECVVALCSSFTESGWYPTGGSHPSFTRVVGRSSYVSVQSGTEILAFQENVTVDPIYGRMKLLISSPHETVEVPKAVNIEIANKNGRFLIHGMLTGWRCPDPERAERELLVTLGEIKDVNRRAHFRLPLEDRLGPCTLLSNHAPQKIPGAILVNLSRGGACLWLPSRPVLGMEVQFQLQADPTQKHHRRAGDLFQLRGVVVHSRAESRLEKEGWLVGLRFEKEETEAFDARQRSCLKHRCITTESQAA